MLKLLAIALLTGLMSLGGLNLPSEPTQVSGGQEAPNVSFFSAI
jgi:hypothetical protein